MAIKQKPDSPTNNFATWNPLAVSTATFSNGNLNATMSSSPPARITSTFAVSSGKYYMEVNYQESTNYYVGISADAIQRDWLGMADGNKSISFWPYNSQTRVYINGVLQSFSGSTTTWASGDIIGIKLDADNEEVSIYKNGNLVGSSVSYSSYGWAKAFFAAGNYINGQQFNINFGQDPTFGGAKSPSTTYPDARGIGAFYYQPPTDTLALCTANLPEMTPTVDDTPQDYFKAVTWTNPTTDTDETVPLEFQADLIWWKQRNFANSHRLQDTVRGLGNTIYSNNTNTNDTFDVNTQKYNVKTVTSTGFTFNGYIDTNTRGGDMVAWCMKAGGAPTADNSNTSGAMTANSVSLNGTLQSNYTPAGSPTIYPKRMSINTDAGFSIVKWTGNGAALVDNTYQSIPTGLSGQLAFAIQKRTDTTGNWHTYHKNCSVAHTYWSAHTYLNSTLDEQIGSGYDSQVFKYTHSNGLCEFQNGDGNNVSSGEYISYFFEEVEGYSKFGSYTGNGSADGPFIYCGFRPAWIMIKQSSSSGVENAWWITDSTRYEFNGDTSDALRANTADEENTGNSALMPDYLSNGFKIRGTDTAVNLSASTYIFMAFAEQPFNYANAR